MRKDLWDYARYGNLAISFGLTMAVSIFLGYYGGGLLDRRLGTAPWLMVTGILFGVGLSFYNLLGELQIFGRQPPVIKGDKEDKHKGDGTGGDPMGPGGKIDP